MILDFNCISNLNYCFINRVHFQNEPPKSSQQTCSQSDDGAKPEKQGGNKDLSFLYTQIALISNVSVLLIFHILVLSIIVVLVFIKGNIPSHLAP